MKDFDKQASLQSFADSVGFFVFLDYSMALWRDLPLQLHKIYDTVFFFQADFDFLLLFFSILLPVHKNTPPKLILLERCFLSTILAVHH